MTKTLTLINPFTVNNNSEEKKYYPNNAKELRQLYNASYDIWIKWLEPLRELIPLHTKLYTPRQVEAIIKELGEPKPQNKAK